MGLYGLGLGGALLGGGPIVSGCISWKKLRPALLSSETAGSYVPLGRPLIVTLVWEAGTWISLTTIAVCVRKIATMNELIGSPDELG